MRMAQKKVYIMSSIRTDKVKLKKLPSIERNATSLSQNSLIKSGCLPGGGDLPLVIQPAMKDVDLPVWVSNNHEFIKASLFKHGGILFRGFDLKAKADFERFLAAGSSRLMHYIEGATPRTDL